MPASCTIFFFEFSPVIWKPAAKSLALLARYKVDTLWASSRAIERLVLTPFRFRASRGQCLRENAQGLGWNARSHRTNIKRVKGRQARGKVGLVYFVYTNPRTWRPENGDVLTEQNDCFVYFLRLPKPLWFNHCLGALGKRAGAPSPTGWRKSSGGRA